MDDTTIAPWDVAIKRPHGILLVTGPTGSGKSTTLYASLARIVTDEIKCITVEDPVEYHVEGVNQIPVHRRVGLDFASGLRAILRHDPDVVMIGEIRDRETAEAAVQASLTGHLVFSTLHTNSAVGAPPRLLDMGVEPFLVASSLEAVLAQRLVRRLCPTCRKPTGQPEAPFEAGGCRECRDTGYRGRHGVYELLPVDEDLRTHIMARAGAGALAEEAARKGMHLGRARPNAGAGRDHLGRRDRPGHRRLISALRGPERHFWADRRLSLYVTKCSGRAVIP